jgi:hypothetical protein
MLCNANVGSFIRHPISLKMVRFSGSSSVDDINMIQTARDISEGWQEVVQGLQNSLDIWQGGLHATGGVIVPAKTSWNLLDFKWKGGYWNYKTISDTPAELLIKDISGQLDTLKRLEYNKATLPLGIKIAPDGNMIQQFETLH